MDESREAFLAFIDSCVASFEAWDILAYLAAHPGATLTLDRMAADLGRRPEDLAAAAALLEVRGVLVGEPDGVGWKLTQSPELRADVEAFNQAIANNKDRLFVLTRLLENLSR